MVIHGTGAGAAAAERNASGGAMPRITKRLVEAAEVRVKDYIICDDELKGFAVRVLPSGRRAYIIQYWKGKRYRRMSLGLHGVLTTEKARRMAFGMLAAVKDGEDPAGDRREARTAVTVAQLAERFDKEHIAVRLKAGTAREYRRNLRRFILPAIGKLKVADVTRADIARSTTSSATSPTRPIGTSRSSPRCSSWPSPGVSGRMDRTRGGTSRSTRGERERYLSPAELGALGEALTLAERRRRGSLRHRRHPAPDLHRLPAQRDHDAEVGLRGSRRLDACGCPTPRPVLGWSTSARQRWGCSPASSAGRTTLGDLRQEPGRPEDRPATAVAAHAQTRDGAALGASAGTPETALMARLEARLGREPSYDECVMAAGKRKGRPADRPLGRPHPRSPSFLRLGRRGLGESLPMIGKLLGPRRCRPRRAMPTWPPIR